MTKSNLFLVLIVIASFSCSSSKRLTNSTKKSSFENNIFAITQVSTDSTYGYSPKNAVNVGGNDKSQGPNNERRYLNLLTGPNGENVFYYRAGSCCPVKSDNGFMGTAMLDNYKVTWQGAKDTVSIYINMYDPGELKAPIGFGIKDGKKQILQSH